MHRRDAASRHWALLVGAGERYTFGMHVGWRLTAVPTIVQAFLARQGAVLEPRTALTPERLQGLLDDLPGFRIRALLQAGRVGDALELLAAHRGIVLVSLAAHFLEFGYEAEAWAVVAANAEPDTRGIVRDWLAERAGHTRTDR